MPDFGRDSDMVAEKFNASVDVERAARLEAGTDVDIPGHGWVALRGRHEDTSALSDLTVWAMLMVTTPQLLETRKFRDRNNVVHTLLPSEIKYLFTAGFEYVSDVYEASWAIKDTDGPSDAPPSQSTRWPTRTADPT